MAFDPTAYATAQVTNAGNYYLGDLKAISEEDLLKSPAGQARAPIDFTYEVVLINRRIATRLRGETPPPMSFEGWTVAPDEFRSKEAAVREMEASVKEMVDAIGTDAMRTIVMPDRESTAFEVANFGALHIMYHDAQLNYLQSMKGDMEMHWE